MATAKNTAKDTTTVTVIEPYQICLEGVVYGPGDKVAAPNLLALEWRESGWVE